MPYLNREEINAVLVRSDLIVKFFEDKQRAHSTTVRNARECEAAARVKRRTAPIYAALCPRSLRGEGLDPNRASSNADNSAWSSNSSNRAVYKLMARLSSCGRTDPFLLRKAISWALRYVLCKRPFPERTRSLNGFR